MTDNPTTPRHRYFRFGLRTMFVVLTVFSLWLGWQAKIVRERKEVIREIENASDNMPDTGERSPFVVRNDELQGFDDDKTTIPIWRRWLGDESYAVFCMPSTCTIDDAVRLSQLFPEYVHITRYDAETDVFTPILDGTNKQGRPQLRTLFWPAIAFAIIFADLLFLVIHSARARPTNLES